jgi:dTDP-4-amino-4,6-dideoxygalactose transaminase
MRATELEAAIGVAQFEGRDENIGRRQEVAEYYTRHLSSLSEHLQLPTVPSDREHNYMMYPIVLKNEAKSDLVNFLEKNNIETREMVPLTNQPANKRLFGDDLEDKYPVAKWINKSGFYVGCHPYLKKKETAYVVDMIKEYFLKK